MYAKIMKSIFSCVFLFLFINLYSVDFSNEFNHHYSTEIKSFKILGERCSGTNFILQLIYKNILDFPEVFLFHFGHKHFLPWFDFPTDHQKLQALSYSNCDLTDSDECLFIFIIRDPYDWIRSFF